MSVLCDNKIPIPSHRYTFSEFPPYMLTGQQYIDCSIDLRLNPNSAFMESCSYGMWPCTYIPPRSPSGFIRMHSVAKRIDAEVRIFSHYAVRWQYSTSYINVLVEFICEERLLYWACRFHGVRTINCVPVNTTDQKDNIYIKINSIDIESFVEIIFLTSIWG